ncbi:MAG: hypothetical protein ACYTDE_10095, partial [Planctomycetota bacterium]
ALELFDLEADPGERVDRSADQPEIRDRLASLLRDWRASISAPMPQPISPPGSGAATESIAPPNADPTD